MDSKRSVRLTELPLQQHLNDPTGHEIKLRYAILLSLVLHIFAYWVIPSIHHTPLPEPIRFEIEIASKAGQQAATPTVKEEPQKVVKEKAPVVEKKVVKPPKKVATKKPKPVLATQSPEAPDQVVVETLTEPTTPAETDVSEIEAPDATAIASENATTDAEASLNQVEALSSAANKTANVLSEAEIWGGYGQKLYTMVGKNKRYPSIAVRRHWEGDVSVLARFMAGALVEVKLLSSSGKKVLDDESIRMVKEAIEQTPLTGNLVGKDFSVTIPVNFALY